MRQMYAYIYHGWSHSISAMQQQTCNSPATCRSYIQNDEQPVNLAHESDWLTQATDKGPMSLFFQSLPT